MGTRNRKNAAAAALCTGVIGNVIWGSSYLFTRIAQNESSPMVQLAWRFALAFLLLNLMILFGWEKLHLRGKKLKPLILLSVVEPLYFFCESYGIYYSNSTFSGVMLAIVAILFVLCIVCPLVVQGWSKQPYALPLMAIGLLLPFVYFFVFGGAQLAKNRQKKQHV